VSLCRRTLRSEGHSATGWGQSWVCLDADCVYKVRLFEQWAAAKCAALLTANAGQFAILQCKLLLF